MSKPRKKGRLPPFIPMIKSTMATPAWRAMLPGARLLYIELCGCLSNDYRNNGRVFLSDRDAAKAIGATPGSVVRWYAEAEHYGFLRKTSEGFLGADGRGIAARYRVTEFPYGTRLATRDFERWNGERFVYAPRRAKRKKQNPVSMVDTPCIADRHIRRASEGASVCIADRHIDTAPRCVEDRHVSRIATPSAKLCLKQGSSTARASAQAGDAGSSPAPVASLTDMVLEIVNAELDWLGERRRECVN